MHTTLKSAIAAAATVLCLAAGAAAPGPRDFDAGAIDQRQARQSERIERAFARGDIDRQQLRSLRHTQREIARAQAQFRADGRINRFEFRHLTEMLDRADEQIRQARRNG
jgi:hypothetical protein